ncbi:MULTISPECIES: beta-galactosidase [Rhodanobacter]|uniref:beta-galactosidase n=1 Tax=Rhodanobacter TaxID=75309 RepID=UPI000482C2CF|nr:MULTISPECIES: beta-galactosidase [Rhodanobacter]TAN17302.1 MAG: beta-galactosidase [Rhodanobacter sp.]UJJ55732.1 beta-galactosidase [Rhodanobacter thiooxydans]
MLRPLFAAALTTVVMISGAAAGSRSQARGAALLHQREPMSFGAFYYPEQWPREQWRRDLDGIARLGFDFTHMGEFGWTYLEPEEGRFDFQWLDDAIDLANKAGLRVILGTPSAAPPAWMGERYPEVYRVDEHGQRHEHGIRAEVSLSNPRYQAFVARLVTAMAQHYGHDRRVWGWQVDNEPSSFADYSDSARDAFRRWLREKYGSIEAMNAAWGGSFWSSRYTSFEQVLLPNATLAAEDKLSPHALLDLARFQADTTARFLDAQAAIIRQHAPGQWVTTNYTNVTTATDPRRSHGLDFPTFTLYPVAGANSLGGDSYAIGKPANLMEAAAYFRPISGTFGVMELQPGQVNWGGINPQPMPGAVSMWMWHAFASGASLLGTYRYRHPLRGSEMYHEGIVGTDGVTLSRTGREFADTVHAIKALEPKLDDHALLPARMAARSTGYLWSHDVFWDLEIQPQTSLWNSWSYRNGYTLAVKSTGAPMDFIAADDDFGRYPFLIAPAYQMVGDALAAKWRHYVEQGGHLILTSRSGQKNASGHFHEGPWAAPILDLIGDDVEGFDMLPQSADGKVSAEGKTHDWHRWADILSPRPGTEVLATYADHYYAGKAAATTRRLGKGTVTMIGVSTDDGTLEREIVRSVYQHAGVAIEDLPTGVFLDWRGGYGFLVNYNPKPFQLRLPAGARIVHGRMPLAPAQVLVWKEPSP